MPESKPSIPLRKIVIGILTCLVFGNIVIGVWLWRSNQQLEDLGKRSLGATLVTDGPQREVKILQDQLAPLYEKKIEQLHRLQSMTGLARSRDDFPVASGPEIVSRFTLPESITKLRYKDPPPDVHQFRVVFYMPPGEHRLNYSFVELWRPRRGSRRFPDSNAPELEERWAENTVSLDLPTGAVHQIEFSVEQLDGRNEMTVRVADHDERKIQLRPSTVVDHRPAYFFRRMFPNQHFAVMDELNRNAWHRPETVRNEIMMHTMTLARQKPGTSRRALWKTAHDEQLRIRCWIESDAPVTASAQFLAAHSKYFLRLNSPGSEKWKRPDMGYVNALIGDLIPIENVVSIDAMFEPPDRFGNMAFRNAPER